MTPVTPLLETRATSDTYASSSDKAASLNALYTNDPRDNTAR